MKAWISLLAAAAAVPVFVRAADTSLLDALRKNDVSAVRALLASGADPNVNDEGGATALMYAALYGSTKELQLLIEKGADVNAANTHGSTALMWATGDTQKVDLLLKRGAPVQATTKDGFTALFAAANHGNVDAMRRLIARGADPRVSAANDITLQSVALARGAETFESIMSAAGLRLSVPKRPSEAPLAATLSKPALLKKFLDLDVKPTEEIPFVTRGLPTVAAAAYWGNLESLGQLLARGASVNAKDTYGQTPLMMAAGAARPSEAIVRLLLDRGADVNARDAGGRTALDWALLQGETPVAAALRAAGAATASPPPALPSPVSAPRSARDAVAHAIARLQPIGPAFNQRTRCISCHNQSLPAIAVALVSRRGVPIDRTLAAHPTTATLDMWKSHREQLLLGNVQYFGGFVTNVGFGLLGMAEEGLEASPITDAVVLGLAACQNRDGSWFIADIRPPLGDPSAIHYTALAIRGVKTYAPPGRRTEMSARVARAGEFIRRAQPASTQDEAFKLLGLLWSNGSDLEITHQFARLLKLQRADGGWAQLPTMAPDAYATGQALYALRAAGMAPAAAAYQKGVQYLLNTQLEDGTWFVRSRGFAFQAYFETGFSHGRDQFISAAATSWAAIALAYTL